MARGRMLNRTISEDRLVADLVDAVGVGGVFYTWLQAYQDRDGLTHGDPGVLKGQVCPRIKSITVEVIEKTLELAHELELLIWYQSAGEMYVCFPRFAKNNSGAKLDREAKSNYPMPPDELLQGFRGNSGIAPDEVRTNSGLTPAVVRTNSCSGPPEEKRIEVKGKEDVEMSTPPAKAGANGNGHKSVEVQTVWGKYREHHPKSPGTLKSNRKEYRLIRERLEDFTVAELCQAIDGYHRSPFHLGENDRKQKYLGLGLIMRDVEHVTTGIEMISDDKPKSLPGTWGKSL